jgi:hypothetical protein
MRMTQMSESETSLAELRRKRASAIERAAALLASESAALDEEIAALEAEAEAKRAAEEAERERARAAALGDAAQNFVAIATTLYEALGTAVPDAELTRQILQAIADVNNALRPRQQTQGRTYHFANPEQTLVIRDDGTTICEWPEGVELRDLRYTTREFEDWMRDDGFRNTKRHPAPTNAATRSRGRP